MNAGKFVSFKHGLVRATRAEEREANQSEEAPGAAERHNQRPPGMAGGPYSSRCKQGGRQVAGLIDVMSIAVPDLL
jgi:hypothetical protein